MQRGATPFFQSLPDETRWAITAETVISLVELAGRARRAGAVTQTCIVHLLRASFRYASRRDWARLAKDLKPIYPAPTEAAALEALAAFAATWEAPYPAIIRLWEQAWAEFVPFLAFDAEIGAVICTTNATWEPQRAFPPLGQGPRPLPQRAGRAQAPVPGHRQPGSHRTRPPALEQPLEGRAERLRHHLRRAHQRWQEVDLSAPVTPLT